MKFSRDDVSIDNSISAPTHMSNYNLLIVRNVEESIDCNEQIKSLFR
jgi:hypothetical protein